MRDFTDDLTELARRVDDARRLPARRRRASAGSTSSRQRPRSPTSGTTRTAPAPSRPSCARLREDVAARRRARAASSPTSRRCTQLGREEGDDSLEPEIDAGVADLRARARPASSCGRSSPASTTSATPSATCTPAPVAPTPRTGPRCCCACTPAGPSGGASTSSSTRPSPAPRPGISSATFTVKGRYAYGLLAGRAGRPPADPDLALRRQRPPPDRVRVARLRARRSTRPRRPRSTRPTCASTPTGRRARVAST